MLNLPYKDEKGKNIKEACLFCYPRYTDGVPPDVGWRSGLVWVGVDGMASAGDRFGEYTRAFNEQGRAAVELLLAAINTAPLDINQLFEIVGSEADGTCLPLRHTLDALYHAALTIIMRLIVLLYMEARHLQPYDVAMDQAYTSLEMLYQVLQSSASQTQYGAWAHIKRLFSHCYEASTAHPRDLSGHSEQLFQPGDQQSARALQRALAIWESWDMLLPDASIKLLLTTLKTMHSSIPHPSIDFKNFATEAIGLTHQSLLDWQLCWNEQHLYLVQRDGARKGSGTFYTPPELVRAITEQALEPLVYRRDSPGMLIPQTPEKILSLKICDPACGSSFFLLAALRYLTDAVCKAYLVHLCTPMITPEQRSNVARLVAEQCLYGVDLSPFTIELARISLWIEVGAGQVPLNFINHKIKRGNALVGTWSHLYLEYPVMAWLREGGDDNHTYGVHYRAHQWSTDLAKMRASTIKPELQQLLHRFGEHQATTVSPSEYPVAKDYKEQKQLFDRWCALWFWPNEHLNVIPTPATFTQACSAVEQIVATLAESIGFFHWELEFPDVFQATYRGFNAILANPPWEMLKPCSREFFQNYDPHYLSYGKQEALAVQQRLFTQDREIEHAWLSYQSYFKNMANWVRHVASPFGDPTTSGGAFFRLASGSLNEQLHATWRSRRAQYQQPGDGTQLLFSYQGTADLNNYKLFLELAHYLLQPHGQLGMLVPAAIYTDQGTVALRRLFLEQCQWRLLFGFVNRRRIFAIHSSFKFVVMLLEKGGRTELLTLTFNQEDPRALSEQASRHLLSIPHHQIVSFSPTSQTILEVHDQRDLAILEKVYQHSVLFGEQAAQSWRLRYTREFDMTNDSHLFAPVQQWQSQGYAPDIFGHWIDRQGKVALPLYEGRMIGTFDPAHKGWVRGKGRSAQWQDMPWPHKQLQPQFLLAAEVYHDSMKSVMGNKLAFMDICSPSNVRSMYASIVNGLPCGNVTPVLQPADCNIVNVAALAANLNSLVYDYCLRCRLGGVHLNYFLIAETPLVLPERIHTTCCARLAARLNLIIPRFAPQWLELRTLYPELGQQHWRQLWAVTAHERLRLRCILDAIIADLYGLDYADLAWILRADRQHIKGFWRIDKEKPEALRQTTLTLLAFDHLKRVGRVAFEAEDWQLPADAAHQLGPRFTDWQCQGSVLESWTECESLAAQFSSHLAPAITIFRN